MSTERGQYKLIQRNGGFGNSGFGEKCKKRGFFVGKSVRIADFSLEKVYICMVESIIDELC